MKSKFKGVYWHKTGKKWVAEIWLRGEKCYIGLFKTPHEAAKAREERAIKFRERELCGHALDVNRITQ